MKTFEEKFTAWVDGQLTGPELAAFERELESHPEALAEKEAAEIVVIEEYMPKSAGDEELRQLVTSTVADLRAQGASLGPKDMGSVMKAVQAKIQAGGLRADGRLVSEMVKAALAG